MVQWFRLITPSAGGTGSTPGWGTMILMPHSAAKKKKKNHNHKKNEKTKMTMTSSLGEKKKY